MTSIQMTRVFIVLLIVVFAAGSGYADYRVLYGRTFVSDSTEEAPQIIPPDTVTAWLDTNRVSFQFRKNHSVVRLDRQRLYLLYENSASYNDIPLQPQFELGRIASRVANEYPDQAATLIPALSDPSKGSYLKVEETMQDNPLLLQQVRNAAIISSCLPIARRDSSEASATVTATDKTRTIGGRLSRRFDISLSLGAAGGIEGEVWIDESVPLSYSTYWMAELGDVLAHPAVTWAVAGIEPITGLATLTDVVLTVPSRLPIHVRDSLVAIEEIEAPDGIYDVPSEYELRPIFTIPVYSEMWKMALEDR